MPIDASTPRSRPKASRACALLATALLASGCAASRHSPGPEAMREPSPAADHSLDTAMYVARGLPAPDREWTGADYARALAVLQPLAQADPTLLPRRSSRQSEAVFARITSDSNLDLLRDDSLPLGQRLVAARVLVESTGGLLALYGTASAPGATFDDEVCDLMVLTLSESATVSQLVDRFVAELPPGERDTPARVQGRAQVAQGLATVVTGALMMLTESSIQRVTSRIRLASGLATYLPVLRPHLPPATQQEVAVRLKEIAAETSDRDLRAAVVSISEAL